ncbi:MAG: SDR family NAD(P)-dependent oxidoreductase [Alphaproteobacteria bacterium]|nr:SDR family NAD(P)-dependent oxidoreductase [Alphaproteobacteria bacterium]
MIGEFRGKTAFVTGGGSGIGLAMARGFGRAGMNVVLADIDRGAAEEAAQSLSKEQIRAHAVSCDVVDPDSLASAAEQTIEAFGKVHVVCNNAGVAVGGELSTVSDADWNWIIDVNLKGVVHGMKVFTPLIRKHKEGGHFINTASMAGMISPPGMEPYCATKFAVVAMSEGWAQQLAPENIGVSVLCPGFVRTRIHESGRARQKKYGGSGDVDALGRGPSEAAQAVLSGIDPDVVGARVLEAVRAGELYIFTHPGMRDIVAARFAAIMSAFDQAEHSPALAAVESWAPVPGVQGEDKA